MTKASDYIIYVDESGDHSLLRTDPQFPVFCLTFCVVQKQAYAQEIVPRFLDFKFRWFGHDMVIFHEADIRRRRDSFVFLGDPEKHSQFQNELTALIEGAPMHLIANVILKEPYAERYRNPMNPYSLSLLFCVERARRLLHEKGQRDCITHIIAEARSPREKHDATGKEDALMITEFEKLQASRSPLGDVTAGQRFELRFADKRANSIGLQLADLVARTIALSVLRPGQASRSYEAIRSKVQTNVYPR